MRTSGVNCIPKFRLLVFWDTLIDMQVLYQTFAKGSGSRLTVPWKWKNEETVYLTKCLFWHLIFVFVTSSVMDLAGNCIRLLQISLEVDLLWPGQSGKQNLDVVGNISRSCPSEKEFQIPARNTLRVSPYIFYVLYKNRENWALLKTRLCNCMKESSEKPLRIILFQIKNPTRRVG